MKKASENDKKNPLNPYALSKLKTENFIIQQSKKKPISYTILRYFNVAGADRKLRTGLITKYSTHLIKIACEVAVGKRDKLIINGDDYDTDDGTAVRDYIHISDLAEIHYLCAKSFDFIPKALKVIYSKTFGIDTGDIYAYERDISKKKNLARSIKKNAKVIQDITDQLGFGNHLRLILKKV